MKKVWLWICNKVWSNEWIIVKKQDWEESKLNSDRYLRQYRPEKEVYLSSQLKGLEADILLLLYREFSSTKNALLIEQKKYSDPVEIAHRDGAILGVDVLLRKLNTLIMEKREKEEI